MAHLRDERRSYAGDPFLVGGHDFAVRAKRVMEGGEEKGDRIGKCAVEIEEEGQRLAEHE